MYKMYSIGQPRAAVSCSGTNTLACPNVRLLRCGGFEPKDNMNETCDRCNPWTKPLV